MRAKILYIGLHDKAVDRIMVELLTMQELTGINGWYVPSVDDSLDFMICLATAAPRISNVYLVTPDVYLAQHILAPR